MRTQLAVFMSIASISFAASTPTTARTLRELNAIPADILRRSISPQFYRSLLISPVDGWIVVQGHVVGTGLAGARVTHSELGGQYDSLALKLAREAKLAGNYALDRQNQSTPVSLHLLVYKIADGTMMLSFAHFDGVGGNQMEYYGCAKLAVLKHDGQWVEIKGPASLHGKGWAVRTRRSEFNARHEGTTFK